MLTNTSLPRHPRHDHYWIEEEELYESYKTIRGLRWRYITYVKGEPDNDKLNDADVVRVETTLYAS